MKGLFKTNTMAHEYGISYRCKDNEGATQEGSEVVTMETPDDNSGAMFKMWEALKSQLNLPISNKEAQVMTVDGVALNP